MNELTFVQEDHRMEHLYGYLCACTTLHLCMTAAVQVQGGSLSVVIGAYVWSLSSYRGQSDAVAGATSASGISCIFSKFNVSRSRASTVTDAGANCCFASSSVRFQFHLHALIC